jgi:hypothetical protein
LANFVEQAILRLDDQTSPAARTINTSLRRLFNTAKALQGLSGKSLNFAGKQGDVKRLVRDLQAAQKAASKIPKITLRVDSSQAQRAITRLGVLQKMTSTQLARMPVSVPQVPMGGRRGGGGAGLGAGFGGANAGFGTLLRNVALTSAAFWTVQSAARLASSALESLATNAAKRDRTTLQAAVQASATQRKVFEQMGGDRAPQGAGAITFTSNERRAFWASILGDVQGDETQRATAASNITAKLEREMLPRLFAAQPDRSREQVLEGFKQIVKALNLASSELTDVSGKFTPSGERAFQGVQLAMAANPDLDPNLIRTTLANLKTSALSLSPRELAQVLISAGDRGVRAANETFRAQLSATGTVDNKALNNALAALGLLKGVERNAKGNVIAGSGRAVDQELLQTDPRLWFNKNFRPQVEAALKKQGREVNDANIIAESARMLPGMSSAGRQAVADFLTGADQMKAALDQAALSLQQSVPESIAQSWTAQAESVGIAWKDMVAKVGDNLAQALGAKDLLSGIASLLRGDLGTGAQVAAGAGVTGAGLGLATLGGRLALGPLFAAGPALTGSATALNGAAAALTRAAVAQGGSGVASTAGGAAAGAAGAGGRAMSFLKGAARVAGWAAVATLATELAIDHWNNGPIRQATEAAASRITATRTSKPGENVAEPGEVAGLKAELVKINAEIAKQKAAEKIPGSSDLATAGLQNQANLITERINTLMTEKNNEFATTFETGATTLKTVGPVIDTAAAAFGPVAGAGIVAVANQFGAIAGAAIAAAANNLNINLKTPAAAANTGTSRPSE